MAHDSKLDRLVNAKCRSVDHLQDLLDRSIENYRMQSFDNFSLDVSVTPTKNAAEVLDSNGISIGFNLYNFDPYSKSSRSMSVRISGKGHVQIWYRKRWRSVDAYLKRLKPTIDWNAPVSSSEYETQRGRCEQQQRWWAANGKVFRFLDLPPEIRELIYGYAIGPRVEPYPTSKSRRLGKYNAAIVCRMPNASLLLTSRLVYQEASNILFKYTPFFIDRLGVLSKLLRNPQQRLRIRRLELALSHIDYFKLFGMKCKDEIFYEPRSAAHVLKNMQLDRLEIYLSAPSATTSVGWLDNACQRTVVDWILDEAWPFIRGHPVELTGYVKRSSRALFAIRLSEERERVALWQRQSAAAGVEMGEISGYYKQLDEEEGGVALDGERALEEWIERERVKLFPLTCLCRSRCTRKRWTSKG